MSEDGTPPPILVLFLATLISLAIFVPLTGILVRFRANYNPKGLQLDSEGGAAPHTGPVVNSYIQMLLRTYKLEVGRCLPWVWGCLANLRTGTLFCSYNTPY